ncbi:MAG TPA: cyclase family protein [Gemmatimonadaceae bacterium]|nr:cyclase family protein [Gemmatimonadaceae bacterium]
MRLRDISVTLAGGTPEWPGDTAYTCGWSATISQGSTVNVSTYTTSPHVGTHADAPLHVRDGSSGSHELPLEAFYGRALVIDVTKAPEVIEFDLIDRAVGDNSVERLLLKTGFSIASGSFPESWPVLSENCARSLLGRGLRLIGVDAPSVDERHSKSLPVHKMIFSGNGCILENLDLRRIQPAAYELIAFPLKIMSLDAAPVRAILRDIE